jgi:multimeric flavodoxin WrbA
MKVIAINASPRPDGNTAMLLGKVLEPIASEGIETEIFQLGGKLIAGCKACYTCFRAKDRRCIQTDDPVNDCILKMAEADGIILGSPTYFADISPELKALIDRAGLVAMANGAIFRRKVGAAVIAVRRGGEIHAFDTINHFFLISQMIVPGSCYWNFGIGRDKGEVANDAEGLKTMRILGENMAWLLKKLQ